MHIYNKFEVGGLLATSQQLVDIFHEASNPQVRGVLIKLSLHTREVGFYLREKGAYPLCFSYFICVFIWDGSVWTQVGSTVPWFGLIWPVWSIWLPCCRARWAVAGLEACALVYAWVVSCYVGWYGVF